MSAPDQTRRSTHRVGTAAKSQSRSLRLTGISVNVGQVLKPPIWTSNGSNVGGRRQPLRSLECRICSIHYRQPRRPKSAPQAAISAAVFPMDLRNPFGPYGCSICCPLGDTLSPQRVRVCGGQRQCREDWIDNGSDCFIYPINTGEFGPTMWDERLRLGGKI